MVLNISDGARNYLTKINKNSRFGKFELDFEFYYLCLMMGLLSKSLGKDVGSKLVNEFPGHFQSSKREQIIGILIISEIERQGINIKDRESVEQIMLKLVDPDSPTKLSSEGEQLISRYAQGGFEIIRDNIGSEDLDTFLIEYINLLNRNDK